MFVSIVYSIGKFTGVVQCVLMWTLGDDTIATAQRNSRLSAVTMNSIR